MLYCVTKNLFLIRDPELKRDGILLSTQSCKNSIAKQGNSQYCVNPFHFELSTASLSLTGSMPATTIELRGTLFFTNMQFLCFIVTSFIFLIRDPGAAQLTRICENGYLNKTTTCTPNSSYCINPYHYKETHKWTASWWSVKMNPINFVWLHWLSTPHTSG